MRHAIATISLVCFSSVLSAAEFRPLNGTYSVLVVPWEAKWGVSEAKTFSASVSSEGGRAFARGLVTDTFAIVDVTTSTTSYPVGQATAGAAVFVELAPLNDEEGDLVDVGYWYKTTRGGPSSEGGFTVFPGVPTGNTDTKGTIEVPVGLSGLGVSVSDLSVTVDRKGSSSHSRAILNLGSSFDDHPWEDEELKDLRLFPFPGDLNYDFLVNLTDFGYLKSNFGITSPHTFFPSDIDWSGKVDLGDLGYLQSVFGMDYRPLMPTPVPEPSAWQLIVLGLGAVALAKGRALVPKQWTDMLHAGTMHHRRKG